MHMKILRFSLILIFLAAMAPSHRTKSASQPASVPTTYVPFLANYQPESTAWLGPEGGTVQSLAIDPQNPNTIYLGTWGSGIYKSLDAGQTWAPSRTGLGTLFIQSLAVDPHNSSVVYAGTYKDRLYKSLDGGNTWFPLTNGIQDPAVIYTIAIDPTNSNRIYIGTRGTANVCNGVPCAPWAGVMYRSEDGGASWTGCLVNAGGRGWQFWPYSIAFDPAVPTWLMAAYDGIPGLYRSTDSGHSWQAANNGLTNYIGRAVVFDPTATNPVKAFYGGWQAYQYPNVFRTLDGGNSWIGAISGINGYNIYKMAITPSAPVVVYAATESNGLYKTVNSGVVWTDAGLPDAHPNEIAIDPQNGNVIYVGTETTGLYKTIDAGVTWNLSQHGLIQSWATSLLVSPADRRHLFMSTYGQGVFQSIDRGLTWTDMSTGLVDLYIHAMAMDPANPNVLFALTDTDGLYRIDLSAGGGWVKLSGLAQAFPQGSPAIGASNPSYGPDYPFAIPEQPDQDIHPELYTSARTAAAALDPPYLAIAFAPSNPSIAYLGTTGAQVYKSTNGGTQWTPSGLAGAVVWSLAVDPFNPDLVYAATSTPGAVKFSTTGGAAWSDSTLVDPNLIVYSLSTSRAEPGRLYAGTNYGIFMLAGGTWSLAGLLGQTITAVAANPSVPGYLYAGTTNGAFTSIDGGASWQPGPAELAQLTITAIYFDPGNPHTVYYATKSDGVLRVP